jgi:hypothetical protein
MLTQPPGTLYQVAYLVTDLEAAARQWAELTGAGPFMLFEHFAFNNPVWNGRATEVDISIALGFSAGLCVELIFQHDDRPSIYRDWQAVRGYGLHHVAILSEDFPAALDTWSCKGAPAVFTAGFGADTRLAYLDTRERLGCYLEVVEFTAFVREALGAMREAHDNWDGSEPLRRFGA